MIDTVFYIILFLLMVAFLLWGSYAGKWSWIVKLLFIALAVWSFVHIVYSFKGGNLF